MLFHFLEEIDKEIVMNFNFISVASDFLSPEQALSVIAEYIPRLLKIGGSHCSKENITEATSLIYFVVGGGTENTILTLQKLRNTSVQNEPVYLLVHPTNNSLPAALEILARLQQDNVKGKILYLKGPHDEAGYEKIERSMHDLEVLKSMRASRIGLIGSPSDWLVASRPSADTIKKAWGPEVISIEFEELQKEINKITNEATQPLKKKLIDQATDVCEPSSSEIDDSIKVYIALKNVIEKYNLNALSVRCFELVQQMKMTGCYALAQLMDDGIIAGCEGDLVSTVGLLWLHQLADKIPWMANPASLNIEHNSLWLAHCTVPKSIVQNYRLRSHFESGIGVGLEGTMWNGPVTLLRIGGKEMEKLWLAEGDIIHAGHAENLCRTQIEIQLSHGNTVSDLIQNPLGNHIVMISGNHRERFKIWWDTMK